MTFIGKTLAAAATAALLTISATAVAAPPGKADYNFDPNAENAVRYGHGYGYSFGYRNPYAAYPKYGVDYGPIGYGASEPAPYPYGSGW